MRCSSASYWLRPAGWSRFSAARGVSQLCGMIRSTFVCWSTSGVTSENAPTTIAGRPMSEEMLSTATASKRRPRVTASRAIRLAAAPSVSRESPETRTAIGWLPSE